MSAALLSVLLLAFLGASVYGFWAYATHDRLELLDRPDVSDAAESACRRLLDDLGAGAGVDRAAAVRAGNVAVERLVASVSAVGREGLEDDRPAPAWLEDWRALVRARVSLAAEIDARGTGVLAVPQTDDGYPVTMRMTVAAGPDCERAVTAVAAA